MDILRNTDEKKRKVSNICIFIISLIKLLCNSRPTDKTPSGFKGWSTDERKPSAGIYEEELFTKNHFLKQVRQLWLVLQNPHISHTLAKADGGFG